MGRENERRELPLSASPSTAANQSDTTGLDTVGSSALFKTREDIRLMIDKRTISGLELLLGLELLGLATGDSAGREVCAHMNAP